MTKCCWYLGCGNVDGCQRRTPTYTWYRASKSHLGHWGPGRSGRKAGNDHVRNNDTPTRVYCATVLLMIMPPMPQKNILCDSKTILQWCDTLMLHITHGVSQSQTSNTTFQLHHVVILRLRIHVWFSIYTYLRHTYGCEGAQRSNLMARSYFPQEANECVLKFSV